MRSPRVTAESHTGDSLTDRYRPQSGAPETALRPTASEILFAGRTFWCAIAVLAVLAIAGVAALAGRIAASPLPLASWGYTAATLTFLLSTAQALPFLAFATRAADGFWGIPLRRACELFATAGLVTAPLFIILLYQLPGSVERAGIWSALPGEPRFWDGLSVVLLAVLGLALLYFGSLPDIAARRASRSDRGPVHLAIGWRGSLRQWSVLSPGLTILGVLYGATYLLVHLTAVTELALFLVPGWTSEIVPAYNVVSGLQAGLAALLLAMAALRGHGGLRPYIGLTQFRSAAALLLALSLLWFYFLWSEFLTFWYGRTPVEQWLLLLLMFGPPLALFVTSAALNFVLPVLLLLSGRVRNSIAGPTLVAGLVLVGSFVDRVRVHVVAWSTADLAPTLRLTPASASPPTSPLFGPPSLPPLPPFTLPDLADLLVMAGGPAAVMLFYLLLARVLPVLSLWEWREGQLRRFVRSYGAATVALVADRGARSGGEPGPAHFTWDRVRNDLLRFSLQSSGWFWWAVLGLALLVAPAVVSIGLLVAFGLQFMGHTHVQQWAVPIVNFSFWSGVSHAGITVSAILRLNHVEWRRPITRAAEALAVFAVLNSAIFAIFHTGRPWRTAYWLFPYDFSRNIWPNVRSMLVWDASALLGYFLGTFLFLYATLIPDLATARDASTGRWRQFYGLLALGFRGTLRQWQVHVVATRLLVSLLLVMFVTDHSIVAWDLSMAIVPGWHSTIMGPYFISGAVYSGLAAVVLAMAALRWVFRLGDYLTRDHFEVVARFLLLSASVWLFFFITHVLLSLRGADPVELRIWEQRLLPAPYTGLSVAFLLTAFVIPVPFWLVRRCRRSPTIMFCTALLVTIGLWLERYLLIMPPLSYKHPFVFTWDAFYEPSLIEYLLILAPFALVALGLLAFARLFPIVPLYEVREGILLEQRLQIGAAEVPAYIRETLEVRS